MKKSVLLCALASAVLAAVPAAHADTTYSLNFSGCLIVGFSCQSFSSDGNVNLTVAGTPTEPSGLVPNAYSINGISGGMTISGNDYSISGLSTGLGGDNMLDLYHDDTYDFDPFGLDFALSTATSGTYDEFRIYGPIPGAEGQFTVDVNQCTGRGVNRVCQTVTDDVHDFSLYILGSIDPAPAATPEPGSLALLGTSILGGAGLLRRRFRA